MSRKIVSALKDYEATQFLRTPGGGGEDIFAPTDILLDNSLQISFGGSGNPNFLDQSCCCLTRLLLLPLGCGHSLKQPDGDKAEAMSAGELCGLCLDDRKPPGLRHPW